MESMNDDATGSADAPVKRHIITRSIPLLRRRMAEWENRKGDTEKCRDIPMRLETDDE